MSHPLELRALRGATTAPENSVAAITAAVDDLIAALVDRNALVVTALVGLEMSSWLHLLQDGDPLPKFRFKPLTLSKRMRRPTVRVRRRRR